MNNSNVVDLTDIKVRYAEVNEGLASRQASLNIVGKELEALEKQLKEKNKAWKKLISDFDTCKKIGSSGKLASIKTLKDAAASEHKALMEALRSKKREQTQAKREYSNFKKEAEKILTRIGLVTKRIEESDDAIYELDGDRIIKTKTVKNGEFIIVGAEMGANTDLNALSSILSAKKHRKAELVITPIRPHLPALWTELPPMDKVLLEKCSQYIAHEYTINNKLAIKELHINAQQADPLSGLNRLAKKMKLIVGSPKQSRKAVPTGNTTEPSPLLSTGVISFPHYRDTKTGKVARHDHVFGGIVVRVVNGETFECHFRILADSSFIHPFDGTRYYPDGRIELAKAKAVNLGDLHAAQIDLPAFNEAIRAINVLLPDLVFAHDFYDGLSTNPHTAGKDMTESFIADHIPSAKKELDDTGKLLAYLRERIPKKTKIVIVRSNHDRFLDRFIESFDNWLKMPKFSSKLPAGHTDTFLDEIDSRIPVMREQLDNIEYLTSLFRHKRRNPGCNILQHAIDPDKKLAIWLDVNDDFRVEGVQCAAHGDKGPNGSKGSIKNLQEAYGDVVFGHTHLLLMFLGAVSCGHLSNPDHGYNEGVNTWEQGFCVIWPEGGRTLYRIDRNKYCGIYNGRDVKFKKTA